jgi:hypothetical protein
MLGARLAALGCALGLMATCGLAQSSGLPVDSSPPMASAQTSDLSRPLPPALYAPSMPEGGAARGALSLMPPLGQDPIPVCVLPLPPPGLSGEGARWWSCKVTQCAICPDGRPWGQGR